MVRRAVTPGGLPADPSGVYVVLTSSDMRESSGFGSRYCGWHTHATIAARGRDLLVQRDWVVAPTQGCAMGA